MTSKQLLLFGALIVALTLSLAWLIERRQVLSLRQELDRWGGEAGTTGDDGGGSPAPREEGGPIVGWPEEEEG